MFFLQLQSSKNQNKNSKNIPFTIAFKELKGLIVVLNNAARWNGRLVQTQWTSRRFAPNAWRGKNNIDTPDEKWTDGSGACEFWAPPKGYVVYTPSV